MKNRFISARVASILLAAMLLGSSVNVYADDTVEDTETSEDAETENPENSENTEEGESGEEQSEDAELVMSSVTASNGKMIAQSFPESIIPDGFHKTTVQYSGANVEVAYMNSDYYGEVVLAYLANSDGSDADFYLCDINTAEMSDFVKITNGEGKFIVVLNPGDNVVAPSGFIKATLNWHGKNVTAWALPKETSDDKDETASAYETLNVYALDSITAGASNSDEEAVAEEPTEEVKSEEDETKEADNSESVSTAEDGSRVEYAPSSDFFLIYAIDQDGVVGFYLYDIAGETFQRYVEIANGDMSLLDQYRNAAKTRLIIIVVLAVLLLIAIVVIINLALKSGGSKTKKRRYNRYDDEYDDDDEEEEDDDDDDDEDEEIEQMRRRVAKKERRHIKQGRRELNYLMDIEDDEEEAEEELEEEEDDDEDEVFEAPVRRKSARASRPVYEEQQPIRRQKKTVPRGGISIEPDDDDDDFGFEFLDLK